MLERLSENEFYCFLDGFSGFFQIPIAPEDQEKTTFTCPYGTFAYRRMMFGLCNAPATFQRCMTAIFHDMVKDFMDDFLVFGNSFNHCLSNLDKMLARCKETNLVLNWKKCHFMVKEGIVLGHKISGRGIGVDRVKIDVIAKLPYPNNVKGVRSFLGHAGFYRRFIKDFSMISKPMTQLLMKDAKFDFSNNCKNAFNELKEKLTSAPIIISPDWNIPFELMCNASDCAVGAVLGMPSQDSSDGFCFYKDSTLKSEIKRSGESSCLSRLENPNMGMLTETEIADEFPDEHLMALKTNFDNDEPWYADYVNYTVGKVIPPKWTSKKRKRFFSQVKYYFWDEPYAFRLCPDNIMIRCVAGDEISKILAHCHSGPTGGHHSASITRRKVYESGFFWPTIFRDAKDYVSKCDANYEVTCEEKAKRRNSGTKTKTFEESTKTASIRRIHEGRYGLSTPAHHKKRVLINSLYDVSIATSYAVLTAVTSVVSRGIDMVELDVAGWLPGSKADGGSNQLPAIAILESYDTFSATPALSVGSDSNGSGVVALLEIARLFSILYSNPNTRGRYNNILWVDIWRALQLQRTRKCLRSFDQRLRGSIGYAICLNSLRSGENGLWLHVSKPPENVYVKQIFEVGLDDNTIPSSVPTLKNNLAGDFSLALLTDPDNKMKQQEKMKRRLNARIKYAKFLEDTVKEMAKEVQSRKSGEPQDLDDFLGKVRTVANDEILGFAKLFNDQLTLRNISRPRLVNMCSKYMGIQPDGTDTYLRYMLRKRLQWIQNDDKMIQSKGGVDAHSEDELHEDCRERGMLGLRSVEEMPLNNPGVWMEYVSDLVNLFPQLRNWLDLSLNHSIPSSLLILSRATLFSLPVDTVGVMSLPFEDSVSERQLKLEKEEEAKKKHSVESNKDVALEEIIYATAAYAQQQLCKLSEA
ncbi:DNA-directed DNA polymerase [Tanacetum coccineum]|uniref:DNA-directed DNA polymerase n=1 Tax=Tanacetum coccineum TaxID=301880 RepID=A0ABQ5J8F0_9ASTR